MSSCFFLHKTHSTAVCVSNYELVKRQNKGPPSFKTTGRCPVTSATVEELYYDTFCASYEQEKHYLYQSIISREGLGDSCSLSICHLELTGKVGLFIIRAFLYSLLNCHESMGSHAIPYVLTHAHKYYRRTI